MEPVTHVLTGACLARAGLNRRAAYATLGMAIAAEFPDIDTLWSLRGPVSGFQHHRGLTHTLLGIPFEAAFLLLCLVLLHYIRTSRSRGHLAHAVPQSKLTQAPVRWSVLYFCLLLALGSHLLLDFTNNYGLRPFYPFQPRWYAASIVFIVDPLILLLLTAGLILPSLFGLVAREVGFRPTPFRGAGWARAALVGVLLLWMVRTYEHRQALVLASAQTLRAPAAQATNACYAGAVDAGATGEEPAEVQRALLEPQHVLASPDPFSPFRWYTAADFGPAYREGTADTLLGTLSAGQVLAKPDPSPVLTAAQNSRLGRIYLDWSQMPWLGVSSADAADPRSGEQTAVFFRDLRFLGGSPLMQRAGRTPLTGEVVIQGGKVIAEGMDGRFGK